MINENELRIWNLLSTSDDEINGICKVIAVNDWTKLVMVEWTTGCVKELPYRLLSPIPLTPEILENAGFDINSAEQWALKKISISFPGVNGYKNGRVYFHGWCIIEDFFLSLHQLQNLFWCLTGEELEIKLQ